MGSFANMRSARDSLCSLIMGTPPGKVYSQLKYVSRRLNEKFWWFMFILDEIFDKSLDENLKEMSKESII